MHIPSLVKIHWYLLKSGNENTDRRMDVQQTDGGMYNRQTDGHMDD